MLMLTFTAARKLRTFYTRSKAEPVTESMAAVTTFEVILYILRCVGLCPWAKTRKGKYEFRWSSVGVLWNIIVALVASFIHLVYVTHVIFTQFFIFGPG